MSDHSSNKDVGPELPPQESPARSGVVGAMMVAVVLGLVLGAVLGVLLVPDLVAATTLGGGMLFGAGRVAIFMSSSHRGLAPIKDEDGSKQ